MAAIPSFPPDGPVLALDTSGPAAAVGLARGGTILGELLLTGDATHSRRLLLGVDRLLAQCGLRPAELGGLAVAVGPGYFTGLRIGLATAQGLALGLGLPCRGVSSLRLLAQAAATWRGVAWAVADARRGLIYAAAFRVGPAGLERLLPDTALSPARLAGLLAPPALLLGDGVPLLQAAGLLGPGLEPAPAGLHPPRPGLLALLGAAGLARGEGVPAGELRPRYVRPSDAEVRFGLPLDEYRLLD